MNTDKLRDLIENGHLHYLPHITIDCVIFGYHEQQLKVLLGQWIGLETFGFPGGYVGKNETLNDAAQRILEEKTSLKNVYLQQFYTFGDSAYRMEDIEKRLPANATSRGSWLTKRTVSIGYYALIDFSKVNISPDIFMSNFKWEDIDNVGTLAYDHNEMLEKALYLLRTQIYHQPIGYNLLPQKFTMPEIQSLYEVILRKQIDRRNFPKKLLSYRIIKKLDEKRKIGQHRSPFLYEFDREGYEAALKNGISLTL